MSEAKLDDFDFTKGEAGGSLTYPIQAGAVKKGGHVVMKGHACKVVEVTTSKTGKHGHAKANIVGIDVFTGNKYQDICPTSHNMEAPFMKRTEYTVLDIQDNRVTLADMTSGAPVEGVEPKVPGNDVGALLRAKWDAVNSGEMDDKEIHVVILTAMGEEHIVEVKEVAI